MKGVPIYLFKGIGTVIVGILTIVISLKMSAGWNVLLWSWFAYFVSVGLKFSWAYLTNEKVLAFFEDKLPAGISDFISWSYLGSLTGIFECGALLIIIIYSPVLTTVTWSKALGFGIGYGALEAILLGLFILGEIVYYNIGTKDLSEEKRQKWEVENELTGNNLIGAPIPIIERISAVLIHAFSSLLIIWAIKDNNYILLLYSFIFKSLVDGIASWMHLEKNIKEISDSIKEWSYQLIFVLLGFVSYIGIIFLK